jgi:hypothetical protein
MHFNRPVDGRLSVFYLRLPCLSSKMRRSSCRGNGKHDHQHDRPSSLCRSYTPRPAICMNKTGIAIGSPHLLAQHADGLVLIGRELGQKPGGSHNVGRQVNDTTQGDMIHMMMLN